MTILFKVYSVFLSLLSKFFIFLQFFLFLRLLLKFLGANPETLVVNILYKYSDVLISPFNFIFDDVYVWDLSVEMSTLSAIAGYAIVMLIIIKTLHLVRKED
jgi:hypothetical protein